jgi:hypothetical protein
VTRRRAATALARFDDVVHAEAERQVARLSGRHLDLTAPRVLLAEAQEFHVGLPRVRLTVVVTDHAASAVLSSSG